MQGPIRMDRNPGWIRRTYIIRNGSHGLQYEQEEYVDIIDTLLARFDREKSTG